MNVLQLWFWHYFVFLLANYANIEGILEILSLIVPNYHFLYESLAVVVMIMMVTMMMTTKAP